jgi:hypothetical protein
MLRVVAGDSSQGAQCRAMLDESHRTHVYAIKGADVMEVLEYERRVSCRFQSPRTKTTD